MNTYALSAQTHNPLFLFLLQMNHPKPSMKFSLSLLHNSSSTVQWFSFYNPSAQNTPSVARMDGISQHTSARQASSRNSVFPRMLPILHHVKRGFCPLLHTFHKYWNLVCRKKFTGSLLGHRCSSNFVTRAVLMPKAVYRNWEISSRPNPLQPPPISYYVRPVQDIFSHNFWKPKWWNRHQQLPINFENFLFYSTNLDI